ncbi:electron transfer flavoprotein subunit alpha/FixB family protein [Calidifontibacillus erzurumensis]|uniref:Electron transfer flavoprotein subunit alpha/FixB family protein n=1 Tax=Calidifontibacillus erzurumensis TaxID=2741433 RepID=A0A8J8KBQ1_9BACI|nr:FAD-binding protein [Calidifontibacillus erzurumensis]NSL51847.1 electron transfer flavoprotein subunit alpha/FixB family protein [Calidifontibacillus erzurumensis]
MDAVICYLPLKNGQSFTEETWGLVEIAKSIAPNNVKLIGFVVYSSLPRNQLEQLPFDEVYYANVEYDKWKVSDYHFQAFRRMQARLNFQKEVYLFSSNPLYLDVALKAAVQSEIPIITNAMEITYENKHLTVKREIYKAKANEFCTFLEDKKQMISIEQENLYGKQSFGKPYIIEEIKVMYDQSPIKFISEHQLDWKELKITEAKSVIGIGRGVYGGVAFDSILQLAEILNAPIGGSKVADELGLIPREKRIGASGSTIEADIYVAIGISGSSQHLEGIKGVKYVVAINNDPSAPIFKRCDIGIVGDFNEVVPKLVQSLLQERQSEENNEYLHIS